MTPFVVAPVLRVGQSFDLGEEGLEQGALDPGGLLLVLVAVRHAPHVLLPERGLLGGGRGRGQLEALAAGDLLCYLGTPECGLCRGSRGARLVVEVLEDL